MAERENSRRRLLAQASACIEENMENQKVRRLCEHHSTRIYALVLADCYGRRQPHQALQGSPAFLKLARFSEFSTPMALSSSFSDSNNLCLPCLRTPGGIWCCCELLGKYHPLRPPLRLCICFPLVELSLTGGICAEFVMLLEVNLIYILCASFCVEKSTLLCLVCNVIQWARGVFTRLF